MAATIQPFVEAHLKDAARLLAARHARDRAREPALPSAFETPENALRVLEQLFRRQGAVGVIARGGADLLGFLLASPMLPSPRHFLAQFFPPRSMSVQYHGHALAAHENGALYRELYGALSQDWVRRGFFDHLVEVPATDEAAREAFDSLGFAREITCAVREVSQPVAGPAPDAAGLDIHQAGAEDIEVIAALTRALTEHHAGSPIFAPYLRETDGGSREHSLELLANPENAHFVAYRDGAPLGMQTFMARGFLSPLLAPDSFVYLLQGIVYGEQRGGGVSTALLAHSMRWAEQREHRWCALHFYTANLPGGRFWLGNGFRPIEERLRRHVDERVSWAGE